MRTTKRRRRLSSSWRRKKETMWTSSGQFKSISSRISVIVWWSVRCSTPPLLDRSSVRAPCHATRLATLTRLPMHREPLSTLDSVVRADDDFAITTLPTLLVIRPNWKVVASSRPSHFPHSVHGVWPTSVHHLWHLHRPILCYISVTGCC